MKRKKKLKACASVHPDGSIEGLERYRKHLPRASFGFTHVHLTEPDTLSPLYKR